MPEPTFFPTPTKFRQWFERNHATASELWVGLHKRHTGTRSITWPEAVDEALSYGWIDGIRKSIDGERYMIRFTPRKPGSNWSAINIRRVAELTAEGRMQPAGIKAFERRSEAKSAIYSYEKRPQAFDPEAERIFRKNKNAWQFFQAQAPYYRRLMIYWTVSAKKPETRARRLAELMDYSAKGERIEPMRKREK